MQGEGVCEVVQLERKDRLPVLSGLVSSNLGPRVQRFRETLGGKEPPNPEDFCPEVVKRHARES